MKLLISGASGMVGSTLVSAWRSQGHQVLTLARDPSKLKPTAVLWAPPEKGPDPNILEGFDAVIHLSGENIASRRWTQARKAALFSSRVGSTRLLAKLIAQLKSPPKALICASAIGYYGDRGAEIVTEESVPGQGFLADLCKAWEAAAEPATALGIRVVHIRIGMVLSQLGGALPAMKRPFEWGVGGPLGSGDQYMSWITLEDLCGIIRYVLRDDSVRGPINAVVPQAVENAEFSKQLARVLHRPSLFRLPAGMARVVFGEMADALLLSSLRVKPAVLEKKNYPFLFPDLKEALQHLLR